jgi:cytochrome c553
MGRAAAKLETRALTYRLLRASELMVSGKVPSMLLDETKRPRLDAADRCATDHRLAGRVKCVWVRSCAAYLIAAALTMAVISPRAFASESSADGLTQAALDLDAHPAHGAIIFAQHCARCHGAAACGNANLMVPALSGQRFAYLVRQLADFSAEERDSTAMHHIVSTGELNKPQVWVDVASYLNNVTVMPTPTTGDGVNVTLGRGGFTNSVHRVMARTPRATSMDSYRR